MRVSGATEQNDQQWAWHPAQVGSEVLILTGTPCCSQLLILSLSPLHHLVPLLLLLQLLQLPLQALHVQRAAAPQQAAWEWIHVFEGQGGQPPAGTPSFTPSSLLTLSPPSLWSWSSAPSSWLHCYQQCVRTQCVWTWLYVWNVIFFFFFNYALWIVFKHSRLTC